jgi:hypothetical protein
MNHNDFSNYENSKERDNSPKLNDWEVKMVFKSTLKHGIVMELFQPPEMDGHNPIPGAYWYFMTIKDGQNSDKAIIKNTAMVDALLAAYDADPKTNVFARIMDADPSIEKFIYDFSPRMKADADGWKLQKSEKDQLEAVLKASNQAAAVKKSKSL